MKLFLFSIFLLFFFLVKCDGQRMRVLADSVNSVNNERTIVIEDRIGEPHFKEFGELIIEKLGEKYFIEMPFVFYSQAPKMLADRPEDLIIPAGTPMTLELENNRMINKVVKENKQVGLHYWSYYWRNHYPPRPVRSPAPPGPQGNNFYTDILPPYFYRADERDFYALCWYLKFELTQDEIEAMSKNKIVKCYISKNGKKSFLPVGRKDKKKILLSAKALLSNK